MQSNISTLSPHSQKILDLLHKHDKPLSAYDILDRLRKNGIKAPPTVYRALDALMRRGLVHRIESLNAFIACHGGEEGHVARFAVCRNCRTATEIHDDRLEPLISELSMQLNFKVEHEMLELLGLCSQCTAKVQ